MGYVKWLGHASFEILLDNKVIYIDPWITNPKSPITLNDVKKADYVFVTHDHGDHLGEAFEIAKRFDATFVGIFELSAKAQQEGVKKAIGANIGGPIKLEGLTAFLVPAYHSSSTGTPVGVVIKGNEATIYHAGDTGVFLDMQLISELYKPDIALLPIGGHFTMGPLEAAKAVELLKPKVAIPMHYKTFDVISGDPEEFKKEVEKRCPEVKVVILSPGEIYQF
ncbi:MAG: metal-dependent hydrolase [Candidatus Njordarchaeales archaeon]